MKEIVKKRAKRDEIDCPRLNYGVGITWGYLCGGPGQPGEQYAINLLEKVKEVSLTVKGAEATEAM